MKKIKSLMILFLLLSLTACNTTLPSPSPNVSLNENTIVAPEIGAIAPDIAFTTLKDQKKDQLSYYRGKYVVLNFWATWCPPCKREMPDLQKNYTQMSQNEMTVLAISSNEATSTVQNFIKQNGYTFPVFLDETGDAATKYSITSIPTTFFINKEGKIIFKQVGMMTDDQIIQYIANLKRN